MDYPSGFFQKKYDEYKEQLDQFDLDNTVKHVLIIQYINIIIYDIVKQHFPNVIESLERCFQLQNIINVILICLILNKKFTLFINDFEIDIKYQLSSKEKKIIKNNFKNKK